MEALRKIDHYTRTYPLVRALAMTPMFNQRPPNDKIYDPVDAKAIELGLPVTITVGIPGPRVPGECQNPIYAIKVFKLDQF
jgi:predicted TIM-barrel fold metal-dependent hydrolase